MEDLYKPIIDELSNSHQSPVELFKDAIEYLALKIMIQTDFQIEQKCADKYFELSEKYKDKDCSVIRVIKLISSLLLRFKTHFYDYLGELYMKIIERFSKPFKGQYFTPYNVSKLMAHITFDIPDNIEDKPITINDPCCGSGGMCIAFVDLLDKRNINYLQHYIIYANDIDITCAYMTYIQLSMAGAAAIIQHKDTITQETYLTMRTAGYYFQGKKQT